MAKSKTEKNLCRTIDKWDDYYNEELLEPIFGYIRENKDKYFVAFREGIITIYYKKRVLISLKPESKDKWTIYRREFFKTKSKNPQIVKEFENLKNEFEDNLKSIGFGKGKQWTMNLEKAKNRDYENLIEATKKYIDKRFEGKDIEETIQGQIMCDYQDINKDLLCIDTEYTQSFENDKARKNSDIKGRYDFIFLKKNSSSDTYKLVFVELKSRKSACTSHTSGVINHWSDMNIYLQNYENNKDGIQENMKAGILFAVETKKKLNLIKSDIKIDFNDPEFWILFKMSEKEKDNDNEPYSIAKVEALIDAEINSAKKTKSDTEIQKMKNNPVKINEKDIPKYDLLNYREYVDQIKQSIVEKSYYAYFDKIKD